MPPIQGRRKGGRKFEYSDAAGDVTGFIETVYDITESVNQQKNFKSILNGMDALITVCDPVDGRILFLNDSIRAYFGIESDGVGQICYKLLQGLDSPCPSCPYRKLRKMR